MEVIEVIKELERLKESNPHMCVVMSALDEYGDEVRKKVSDIRIADGKVLLE